MFNVQVGVEHFFECISNRSNFRRKSLSLLNNFKTLFVLSSKKILGLMASKEIW